MTECVKPEQDWQTVQGAVRLVGQLAVFAEDTAIRMRGGISAVVSTILESASLVVTPGVDCLKDDKRYL